MQTGWLAGLAAVGHILPDLSGLAGWNPAWGFVAGSGVEWSFNGSSYRTGQLLDGAVIRTATRLGTSTP